MRLSHQGMKVLGLFASAPSVRRSGFEISKAAGVGTGTLYPLLAGFERRGWLESSWEDVDPVAVKRPRRRYYTLTDVGKKAAYDAQQDMQRAFSGEVAWTI